MKIVNHDGSVSYPNKLYTKPKENLSNFKDFLTVKNIHKLYYILLKVVRKR